MSLSAAMGVAQALDGREAALQATHQALDRIGNTPLALGIILYSQEFPVQNVVTGVSSLLGNTPLWGFSTSMPLTGDGYQPRSVVVALLAGSDIKAQVQFWATVRQGTRAPGEQLFLPVTPGSETSDGLLITADGFGGDIRPFLSGLPGSLRTIVGGLSGGDSYTGKSYQIGGNQSGASGMATAHLQGSFKLGTGLSHGWKDVGFNLQVTQAGGLFVRTLDGVPAAEAYAKYLGYTAKEWVQPPLSELVRLYPLGIEEEDHELSIHAPLRIEGNGSLRMNSPIAEGSTAHLMIGNTQECMQEAQTAAKKALAQLKGAKPVLGLLLMDLAWRHLLVPNTGQEMQAVQAVVGNDLPLAGAYTVGQIAQPKADQPPTLYNQQIQVILFGE